MDSEIPAQSSAKIDTTVPVSARYGITGSAALPAGSYLAIYDSANVDPRLNEALRDYNESGAAPYRVRSPDYIRCFFDGLGLVDPGVVPIQQWRPEHTPFGPPKNLSNNLGGVAGKALSRKAGNRSFGTDA
jgi:S-adenosyl methyltransferase